MAKPRIFISSTFYDLRQVRADIDFFIEQLGYEPIRNEEGEIPYGNNEALEEYCYKEIKNIDILISVIGGRFGSESKRSKSSISQIELKTAQREGKQVYIFIENNILSEFETYLLNKDADTKYRYVDDRRIYEFIEEIKSLGNNNVIKGFETATDITRYLKDQFAGLFQRFLDEQTRTKEVSVIRGLEKTSNTLNTLVNYLSDQNKDQANEINRILMIQHPIVDSLKSIFDITYNIYIEGYDDMRDLILSKGFLFWNEDEDDYLWVKNTSRKKSIIAVSKDIFDVDGKLKFYRRNDWNPNWVDFNITEIVNDDDDLPF